MSINMVFREEIIGDCRLILGDSHEVLTNLLEVDACITDPPYGTGWINGGGKKQGEFKARNHLEAWDRWNTSWIPKIQAHTFAVFCPDSRIGEVMSIANQACRLRYYIKTNPRPALGGNDSPSVEPIVIWPRVHFSKGPTHKAAYNGDAIHPCQKPVEIMEWLILGLTTPEDTVLDPFLGSGSTLVACAKLGRKGIGVEISEKYFDIACQRVEDAYRQGDLLQGVPSIPRPQQVAFSLDGEPPA
jgi:site-specific DNA-methyltransferase (adenine-specific)